MIFGVLARNGSSAEGSCLRVGVVGTGSATETSCGDGGAEGSAWRWSTNVVDTSGKVLGFLQSSTMDNVHSTRKMVSKEPNLRPFVSSMEPITIGSDVHDEPDPVPNLSILLLHIPVQQRAE